jgi:uncharacterized protein (TIGR03435 family)
MRDTMKAVIIATLLSSLTLITSAQNQPLAFEVASVKPNDSGGRGTTMGMQPGRYTATNVTLRTLIVSAYRLQSFQLLGGLGWISSDHFDIVAKIPDGVPLAPAEPQGEVPTQFQLMLRALLADRFKLVVHNETREMPIYALVTVRSDKKLGPEIHPSTIDCGALAAQSTLKEKEGKQKSKEERGSVIPATAVTGQSPPCNMVMGPGRMSAGGVTMATLASSLSGSVQRMVLDRTGVEGTFDTELTWTPDQMPQGPTGGVPKITGAKIDPNGPSIFTALQEQLGLKLESARGSVDVLVIDSVQKPSEN